MPDRGSPVAGTREYAMTGARRQVGAQGPRDENRVETGKTMTVTAMSDAAGDDGLAAIVVPAGEVERVARELCRSRGQDPDATGTLRDSFMEDARADVMSVVDVLRGTPCPVVAEGGPWRLAPEEPTEEMLVAAGKTPAGGPMPRGGTDTLGRMLPRYWKAMFRRAPRHPALGGGEGR